MKHWLLTALLANMALLWIEIHYGAFDAPSTETFESRKQGNRETALMQPPSRIPPPADDASNGGEKRDAALMEKQLAPQSQPVNPAVTQQLSLPDMLHSAPAVNGTEINTNPLATASLSTTQTPLPSVREKTVSAIVTHNPEKSGSVLISPRKQPEKKPKEDAVVKLAQTAPQPPQVPQQANTLSTCFTTGPVENPQDLSALIARFRPQLTEVILLSNSSKKSRNRISYLVYTPASSTMEQSQAIADILKKSYGVEDLNIIRDGELKGAISLGVFNNQQNAILARQRLEKKGVKAEVKPRLPVGTAYTIKMRWSDQQDNAALQFTDALSQNYPEFKRTASCQ